MSDQKKSISEIEIANDLNQQDKFVIAHLNDSETYETKSCTLSTITDTVLNKLEFDEIPSEDSDNLVKSKDIKAYVDSAISSAIHDAINTTYIYTEEEING